MRELDLIRSTLTGASARGEGVVLVTVMAVEGSVYRGAGARMIVTAGGATVGAVSGGCLEADLIARAPDVLKSAHTEFVRYDTRTSDDEVMGLGMGCQGVIDLLLEPLAHTQLDDAISFYERLANRRDAATLWTLIQSRAGSPPIGTRLLMAEDGSVVEGDPVLLSHVGTVAHEVIRPATRLIICGGGADAIPLTRLATQMGCHVTVIDHRPAFASRSRFPDADALVCANLVNGVVTLADCLDIDERTMAVVMAHSAAHDGAYLHGMLDGHALYIGVLGPRRRTLELLGARWSASDGAMPPSVHSPAGLDIGAETPDEIALSIAAEILAVAAGRDGAMLRDRCGPIHDRPIPAIEV